LDWLYENEALNNGIIGTVDLLVAESIVYSPPYWFATIEERSGIVGVGLHATPDGLVMSHLPVEAAGAVFESVDNAIGPPHRILAPEPIASGLASRWMARQNIRSDLNKTWNVYVLNETHLPMPDTSGFLRPADKDDETIARLWGRAYGEESPAPVDVAEFMLRKLRRKEMYVWDDNGPTTIVTLSGMTRNGCRISSLYTPGKFRGRGYGSAAVTAFCEMIFENGTTHITLAAVAGEAAERIYQRLGFRKIGSRVCYSLSPLLHDL
jgi:RimJ/RimL family protein N-acetyltransferase